jgi:MraZ protein
LWVAFGVRRFALPAGATLIIDVFRGINSVRLDDKGRLALPVRFREAVVAACAGNMVVTIDASDACLLLYPLSEWEVVQRHLEALANVGAAARTLQRLLIGHATDLALDGNGRVRLPSVLREHAGLDRQITLVGQGNKIEVWSDAAWAAGMSRWVGSEAVRSLAEGETLAGLRL